MGTEGGEWRLESGIAQFGEVILDAVTLVERWKLNRGMKSAVSVRVQGSSART